MKQVKAKQTLHGAYGLKSVGDEFPVHDSIAEKLLENDLVELVEDKGKDTKSVAQQNEEQTVAKNKEIDTNRAAKGEKKAK